MTRVRDMIDDPQKKAMWDFVALPAEFGTAFVAAPGVPDERLRILRQAFDATMKSDEMIADAKKRVLDINPKSGDALDRSSPRPARRRRRSSSTWRASWVSAQLRSLSRRH